MNIGEYRHRVAFQRNTPTRNSGTGSFTDTWTTFVTRWARVRVVSGDQVEKDQRDTISELYEIFIRYRSDIHANMRAIWKGRTLEIDSAVEVDGHDRELKITAHTVN